MTASSGRNLTYEGSQNATRIQSRLRRWNEGVTVVRLGALAGGVDSRASLLTKGHYVLLRKKVSKMDDATRRRVVILKWAWLAASETFVRNHAESLSSNWEVYTVGAKKTESSLSSDSDQIIFNDSAIGSFRRELFRFHGRSADLDRILNRISPDLIHIHFGTDATYFYSAARRNKIPFIVTLHGSDITAVPRIRGLRGRLYRSRLRRVFEHAEAVVAVSEHIGREAVRWGADRRKVHVIPPGVPDRTSSVVANSRSHKVLAIGRMVEKKGFGDLLRAASILPDDLRRDLELVFIGDGPLREALTGQASELGLSVDWRGLQPSTVVEQELSNCAFLAVPSRTAPNGDTEGLPTVLFEAARAGTPVVAYRHAGIPEAVADKVTGLLVEEGDVSQLAAAMESLLRGDSLRTKIGRAARDRFEQNFDMSKQTQVLEELYILSLPTATR